MFAVTLILYYLKNEKKYPTFAKEVFNTNNANSRDLLKKTIQDFYDYFNSNNYKNHENELYNKIFLKFKGKNDNNTIDINEFINELNP